MTILEQAAQVLHEEARAIEELSSRLDHNFVNAVNMILACKGRVVCTGMGKSGHIGRLPWLVLVHRHFSCILVKVCMAILV